ncbi:hypothetical protein WDW37_00580 [Bdellovibrionota bacterium FG-1]
MKTTLTLALLTTVLSMTSATAMAASPAAVVAAVKAATNLSQITEVKQIEQGRCFDCYTFLIEGSNTFGTAYAKVETERTGPTTIKARVIEQSR